MADKIVREPIATWWKIEPYKVGISPVQVVWFTGSFVTRIEEYCGRRHERRERRDDTFPTFEEAYAEAIRRAEIEVKAAQESLQRARTKLGHIQALKQP